MKTQTAAWQTAITILQVLTAWATPAGWAVTRPAPAHMARWIWQATSGNGLATGIQAIIIQTLPIQIHKVRRVALGRCCAVEVGTGLGTTCARQPASPTTLPTTTNISGFVARTLQHPDGYLRTTEVPDRAGLQTERGA